MKILLILIILLTNLKNFVIADEYVENLKGHWFECEFSNKITPPTDDCEMLDDDGFEFKNNYLIHIKNIASSEKKCKKNKIGQCFKSDVESIIIEQGRKDKVKFENSYLILSFLGCNQYYKLINKKKFVQAIPNKKKCFWSSEKNFFLKRFKGNIVLDKEQ